MRQSRIRVFVIICIVIICIILGVAVGILDWIVCENCVLLFTAIVLVRVFVVAIVRFVFTAAGGVAVSYCMNM